MLTQTNSIPLTEKLARQTLIFSNLMARIAVATNPDQLTMTIPEAAVYTQLNEGQLAQLRYLGTGPKFMKPSPRTVLYTKGDLDEWLHNSVQTSTAKDSEEDEQRAQRVADYKAVAA